MQMHMACHALFDELPDVVFFCKDAQGRYTHGNQTLLERLGLRCLADLQGKTAVDVFPPQLGGNYLAQDLRVVHSGHSVVNELERHLFPNHQAGWCLTVKHALTQDGTVQGLIGISRDLRGPSAQSPVYQRLARSLAYARAHCTEPLSVGELASHAGLSVAQLERHVLALLQLTPGRWLLSLRLEAAMRLLDAVQAPSPSANRGAAPAVAHPVAHIAAECGFSDHSAFTRAFRRHVGLTPNAYRQMRAAAAAASMSTR